MARPASVAATQELNPYRWLILFGLITAAVLEILDTTIVNVALPQMAGSLGATAEEIGWVSTGYILSNVIVLPLTAWLSSRFGRRRYLSYSILIFVAASFFCGTSGSLGALVFWRIIQGAGGAALLSTAQATLREVFPPGEQGMVQAIYMLGIIAAPTLGPTLGGVITDNYSWSWVFFINLPIGLVSFFVVSAFLEDSKFSMRTKTVDWGGIALLATGLGALQYVFEEGNSKSWFEDSRIVVLTAVAAIALPLFVFWQLSKRNVTPIVNLHVLRNRDLSAALVLFVALGFGLYGGVFLYPMFAENVLHLSPTITGMALLPGGIATGVAAIMCGRIANPVSPLVDARLLITIGLAMFTSSLVLLGRLPSTANADSAMLALLLRGFGLGMLFIPINLAAFANLKGAEIAQGAAMLNLCRQLGGSFGIAVLSSFVTHSTAVSRAGLSACIYAGNTAFQQRFQSLTHLFAMRGFSAQQSESVAYSIINRQLGNQSTTLAFNSGFILIAIVSLVASPLVLILRKPNARPIVVEAH